MGKCEACDGTGVVECPDCEGHAEIVDENDDPIVCYGCNGSGDIECANCDGTGCPENTEEIEYNETDEGDKPE